MKGYYKLRKRILEILNTELSSKLHYHGVHHTLNSLQICKRYIQAENIKGENAKLLRIGILLHDIGFTISNVDHEEKSVSIADSLMTEFYFSKKHKELVKGMILATKIPQKPKNQLERIICDIDLDYLGRADFYKFSDQLFKELKDLSVVKTKDEWNSIQIDFLKNHKYHTDFGINYRQPEKEKRIAELESLLM